MQNPQVYQGPDYIYTFIHLMENNSLLCTRDGPFILAYGFDLLGEKPRKRVRERVVDSFILFLFEVETLNREGSKLFKI